MPTVSDTSGQVAFVIACLSGGWGLLLTIVGFLAVRQINALETAAKSATEEARKAWSAANDAINKLQWLYDDYKAFREKVATREAVDGLRTSFDEVKRDVRDTGRKVEELRIVVKLPPRKFTPDPAG